MIGRLCLPVVVALVGVTTACGEEKAATTAGRFPSEPLSSTELGWIRAYSLWTFDVYDDELGTPGAALVATCRERLDEAGRPPSKRLEPAAAKATEACAHLALRGSVRRARDIVDDADDLVRPLFLDSYDLPLRHGRAASSAADLELSRIASRRADDAVEVRCWNHEDWRRVVRERNAWLDFNEDPDDLYGWQDGDENRIHMRLEQCNLLQRLRTEDVTTWMCSEQVEASDSLDTLAHEIQHFAFDDADESEVECAAIPTLGRIARLLGATAEEAGRLVTLYRTRIFPDLPDEYADPSCAP